MFNIPMSRMKEFKSIYEKHILNTSACNIFYYHIKLIAKRPALISRDDYNEHFNLFSDIELVTAPMDTFVEIPDEENEEETEDESIEDIENTHVLEINRLCPEFVKIQNRISEEQIRLNFPPDHNIIKYLDDPTADKDTIIDVFTCDCFYHWCVQQYLADIGKLRLSILSNITPLIEYTVENIDLKTLTDFMSVSKNINQDKIREYSDDVFFKPDYEYIQKYYMIPHGDIEQFDVKSIMDQLITNIVVKSDIYIIIAIYMILSYCKIAEEDKQECSDYVRDVLSKL